MHNLCFSYFLFYSARRYSLPRNISASRRTRGSFGKYRKFLLGTYIFNFLESITSSIAKYYCIITVSIRGVVNRTAWVGSERVIIIACHIGVVFSNCSQCPLVIHCVVSIHESVLSYSEHAGFVDPQCRTGRGEEIW